MFKPRIKWLILLLLKQANIIVTILTALGIFYLRSAHSFWFGLGTLISSGSAKLLKKCIQQPRPSESFKKSYGMPSTHSSTIVFYGVYLSLSCLLLPMNDKILRLLLPDHHPTLQTSHSQAFDLIPDLEPIDHRSFGPSSDSSFLPPSNSLRSSLPIDSSSTPWILLVRSILASAFLSIATAICWSRVKLGYHSPRQVIVGALIGATIAWFWFGIWSGFNLPTSLILPALYPSSSPSIVHSSSHHPTSDPRFLRIPGLGITLDDHFRSIQAVLVEAWNTRDFGLIWDSLVRPTINRIGFRLGLHDEIIDNGLPPRTSLHPIKPHSH